jgi:H+/Cl- antiporter ClcA
MREWLPRSAIAVFGVTLVLAAVVVSRAPMLGKLMATDDGSPGDWRLTYEPMWLAVAVVAAVIAILVTVAWVTARRLLSGWSRARLVPYVLAVALGAGLAVSVVGIYPGLWSEGCDGTVPRWMLPAGYSGGGCIPWPENWESTQPWTDEDMVCLGLCSDPTLPYQ